MRGVGHRLAYFVQVGRTANRFKIARRLQTVYQQRDVDLGARVVHLLHLLE